MEFADWYAKMCNKTGEEPTVVAKSIGATAASGSYWVNGKRVPKKTTLVKIEEHFGEKFVPDAEPAKEKSPTSEDVELDELGQELVELLIKLTPDEERQVYSFVQGLLAARKV